MAARREEEAANLEEIEIYISIVSKFIKLDMSLESKVEMMIQACGEETILIDVLKECVSKEILTDEDIIEYLQLLESDSSL